MGEVGSIGLLEGALEAGSEEGRGSLEESDPGAKLDLEGRGGLDTIRGETKLSDSRSDGEGEDLEEAE